MLCCNKRGEEGSPWGAIFAAVLGLVFLAMFIGIIIVSQGDLLTKETATQTGCWLTNSIKCTGGVFASIPTLCTPETVDDPIDTAKLASLTRETWWMFKENTCDLGNVVDKIYPVYAFTPKEDMSLVDFTAYTLTHNSAGQIVSGDKSDYAYLETNTPGQTICFDKSKEDSAISNLKLEKGKVYYILYYDDQPIKEEGDKILITDNPKFDAGYWKEVGIATAIATGGVIVAATTAGAGVAIYTGGISGISAITAGTELAVGLIGTKAAIITASTVAGASGSYYVSSESDDSSCVLYGSGSP